jgi:Mannosylglycerate hydrolase MGH1-like glycoside hydrolase domain/Glycosyl hydrolase family 63 C-terminal domain
MNRERERLLANVPGRDGWKHWGPYLSERQWGTVREDYSAGGTAWEYFPHDHARSRVYRWGEDGIAGVSDANQLVCLSLALWNGRDSILKERLFGLTNAEGNHGEDVKEQYFYLDATPTHSYLKMLYKYPQREYPYADLVEENGRRGTNFPEYELLDTGVFEGDRYFDVFVEYAQAEPGDVLMKITAWNRGPDAARLHVIPQLVLRNTWSWQPGTIKPLLRAIGDTAMDGGAVGIEPADLEMSHLYVDGNAELLFTENESNAPRLWNYGDAGYFKDGFHDRIVGGNRESVNPAKTGTKAAAWHQETIQSGGKMEVRLRLSRRAQPAPFADFEEYLHERRAEADEFYADLQKDMVSSDERTVQRQAFAGMIWNKQFYHLDVARWLKGDPSQPTPPEARKHGRNSEWRNLNNADILSMPDKWEYPWYASWDLAFHCIPFALIDAEFAKHQLVLLTREWYMRPNGQIPAYEWAFSDVNPPVHGWAAWRVYQIDRKQNGGNGDLEFLERVFHKLMLNFTWWVNQKDHSGRNIFQGGFLGLDNIGVFDRSARLPTGGYINQSDGTSWMAMYALNLMRIALELAEHNHVYEDIASKFFEHFLNIAEAMSSMYDDLGLWDERDQFFYDVLNLPDDVRVRLRIRSMVGLIPLFAVETLEPELLAKLPGFTKRLEWFLAHRPDLAGLVSHWQAPGRGERRLLSLLRGHRMKKLLRRMLDETEFLSEYGVRAMSRVHLEQPYVLRVDGANLTVRYASAESDSRQFGGNSNWRGPIWFPMNFLIIESLQKFHHYYGDDFKVECPTGSGHYATLAEVAAELSQRLSRLFLKDASGDRPVLRQYPELQSDPHYRDCVPFYEFFDGDNGRGAGASHQTGWTGLIAKLLMPRAN